jgi:hypothetical protein
MREDAMRFINKMAGEIIDTQSEWYKNGVDLDNMYQEDKDAVYGMGCMMAYLNGVRPTLDEFSDFLEVPKDKIRVPFQRLLQSGIFSKSYNARGDTWLNLNSPKRTMNEDEIHCAWGYIAGISSDTIIRNYSNMNIKAKD